MTLVPSSSDAVVVHRVVDAAEDDVVDALTEFAVVHKLDLDRTYVGDGLLFRAVLGETDSREELERAVANELHRLSDGMSG